MIVLNADDFRPLKSFEELYRWTDEESLPTQILTQFQPLTHEMASRLWSQVYDYSDELWSSAYKDTNVLSSTSDFLSIHHLETTRKNVEQVAQKLAELSSVVDELIVVMWEPKIALITKWRIFANYWNEFCFPVRDDLIVCPLSGQWLLAYYHEDVFIFGIPKQPLSFDRQISVKTQTSALEPPSSEVLRLLKSGQRVPAIKLYQKETGVPFRAVIDYIDRLIKGENIL